MKYIKNIFNFYLFYLENKFYYPKIFNGKITFFILLKRFKQSLFNVNKMERNYNNVVNKPISYISTNSKTFNLSLKEDKLNSHKLLLKFFIKEIQEDTPYKIYLIAKGDILRVNGQIIDFGSIHILKENINIDSQVYKSYLTNKMHHHLWIFLECLDFLHGIDSIHIAFFTDKSFIK